MLGWVEIGGISKVVPFSIFHLLQTITVVRLCWLGGYLIVDHVISLNYELLLANYSYMIFVSVEKCYAYLLTVMVIVVMTPQGAHLHGGIFTNLKFLD